MSAKARRTRCDAVANRTRIVTATADLLVRDGAHVPMEEIARHAGIGIATLYRHFPNRTCLLRAVALRVLTMTACEAQAATANPDAFTALTSYLHTAIDRHLGAAGPALAALAPDPELDAARTAARAATDALVTAAHRAGVLPPAVSTADAELLVLRCARPLPGEPQDHQLGHRHLDLLLDGLRAAVSEPSPAG
jgi:AcrR family transcriptional regulator